MAGWGRKHLWIGGVVLLALVAGLALTLTDGPSGKVLEELENLPARALTRWVPPQEGELLHLGEQERQALERLAARLEARIVWSSNRAGNHELYLLDLRELRARRLTEHPNVDFFSRFSPDGERIVFNRSQREWVSFRDPDAWDIYLINSDGTGERLLVRNGYHPTWGADGRTVTFLRQQEVFGVEVETGRETLLFSPRDDFPGDWFGDPELSPDASSLAMGIGHFGAGVIDLETGHLTPLTREQACQTTWSPDGGAVVWVEAQGNGGTRVVRARPDGSEQEVLIDLPGEYSHEYFPTLADDGRWLVWGAAAEGHEHDRADYEIFIWEVGSTWDRAIRLTHYTGNDQWPDIHVGTAGRE